MYKNFKFSQFLTKTFLWIFFIEWQIVHKKQTSLVFVQAAIDSPASVYGRRKSTQILSIRIVA